MLGTLTNNFNDSLFLKTFCYSQISKAFQGWPASNGSACPQVWHRRSAMCSSSSLAVFAIYFEIDSTFLARRIGFQKAFINVTPDRRKT